jgi:hypothetical protein
MGEGGRNSSSTVRCRCRRTRIWTRRFAQTLLHKPFDGCPNTLYPGGNINDPGFSQGCVEESKTC